MVFSLSAERFFLFRTLANTRLNTLINFSCVFLHLQLKSLHNHIVMTNIFSRSYDTFFFVITGSFLVITRWGNLNLFLAPTHRVNNSTKDNVYTINPDIILTANALCKIDQPSKYKLQVTVESEVLKQNRPFRITNLYHLLL